MKEIKKRFPNDFIQAEELHSKQEVVNKGRIWLIDPICGTPNFARAFGGFFATNIALARDGRLIASCVIDHSQKNYIWSVGSERIYINNKEVFYKNAPGVEIEVDFGVVPHLNPPQKKLFSRFTNKLLLDTNYSLFSHGTTLAFAYVALGKIDGYISWIHEPLHKAAAIFLILQSGGIVTDFSGKPWTLQSSNVVAAHDKALHEEILGFLKD